MEVFRNDDNTVAKFLHDDGSETAIKSVSSCNTIIDQVTGELHANDVDRKKFSIFASSSVGCMMKCKFCYLTIKEAKYKRHTVHSIDDNISMAVEHEITENPGIVDRYLKLCWMSSGEDHMIMPERTRFLTGYMVDKFISKKFALGLDGVDLATVMPPGSTSEWKEHFGLLEKDLAKFDINPNNSRVVHSSNSYSNDLVRSRFRIFYSLHSAIQEERDSLIPKARPIAEAVRELEEFNDETGCNIIFHHMFMSGQNDSDRSVDALLEFMSKRPQHELRILRYNSCTYSPFPESEKFNEIVARLSREVPRLKVQISVGKEVSAACGQFIVKSWSDRKE